MLSDALRRSLPLLLVTAFAACEDEPTVADATVADAIVGDAAHDAGDTVGVDVSDVEDGADDGDSGVPDASDVQQADAADGLGDLSRDAADLVPDLEPLGPYPAPDAWGPNTGPGVPAVSFTEEQLFTNCTYLDGGANDLVDHHNLVTMYDGLLLMPWAPEWGGGGLTLWDLTDPCDPVTVGQGYSASMRETHSIGFSHIGGTWAVVNGIEGVLLGGIQFWDLSDITAPEAVSNFNFDGFLYPDAYARVSLSVFWQAPYVYVAQADVGIQVVDATNPREPELVSTYTFDPILRAGQVQAIGNLLIVTSAEGSRTALLDISDPGRPQPIPGGDFLATDGSGTPRDAYFTNSSNGYIYYARKDSGGGVVIWDIHDPEQPVYSGDYHSTDGNGGYVFVHEDYAFTGESHFAAIYDISDHDDITELTRLDLEGDLDTLTPLGHLAILSVDDEALQNEGTAIAPWRTTPDDDPPRVTWSWPADGATAIPLTSRIGLTFDEQVDVRSAFDGSVRLYETGTDPDETRVPVYVSAQEAIVNVWPVEPLRPGTQYTVDVPVGGVTDFSGNATESEFSMTVTTVGE